MSRLQGEVSDLQAQLGAANKELKRVRKQLEQQREAAVAAEREQRQALAGTIDGLAKEVAAGKEAAKGVHKQLQVRVKPWWRGRAGVWCRGGGRLENGRSGR